MNWLKNIFRDYKLGVARSPKWRAVRKEHLEFEATCQACGTAKDLEVHHIEPVHKNPSRELDKTNLITLCSQHHFDFGHLRSWYSWNKTVENDVLLFREKIIQRP